MAHSMPQPRAAPTSVLNRPPGSADHFSALEEGLSPAADGGGRASGRGFSGSGHSINQQKVVFMETLLGTSVSEVRVRCCLLCIYMPVIDRSLSDCRAAQRI